MPATIIGLDQVAAKRADRRIEPQRLADLCLDYRQKSPSMPPASEAGVHEYIFNVP